MTDFDKKITIAEDTQDYLLTLINDCPYGMGLRVKAGEAKRNTTETSVAILSVADKENDNKFIIKSNGHVVSYYNHQIGDVFIERSSIGTVSHKPVEFKVPLQLPLMDTKNLPNLKYEHAGSVVSLSDRDYKPCYYDGSAWRYFSNNERVK